MNNTNVTTRITGGAKPIKLINLFYINVCYSKMLIFIHFELLKCKS